MASPDKPLEIASSFGTTGSMISCVNKIRGRITDISARVQTGIPGVKIPDNYIRKFVDFADDVTKLVDFAQNAKSTWDGDSDECSEPVLEEMETRLSWKPGSQSAIVLIGDCNAHESNYPDTKLKFDWRVTVDELGKIRVRIYSFQCHDNKTYHFNSRISQLTDGKPLKPSDLKHIFDYLIPVCYKEKDDILFVNYEKEVRACSSSLNKNQNKLFGNQSDKAEASSGAPSESSVKPVKKLGKRGKIVKAVKPAKPVLKAVKKSPASIKKMKAVPAHKKYLEKNLPKLRRENVTENNFLLREMNWSKWQLVVHPNHKVISETATQLASDVSCPRQCCHGYRAKTIFGGKTQVPAIYEIGVQTNTHARKYVTYSKMCRGFTISSNWENKLFGRKDIRKQIDNLVTKDCSVYIRKMLVKGDKSKMKVRQALRRYDYAWKGLKSVRDGHRNVLKGNVEISCEIGV